MATKWGRWVPFSFFFFFLVEFFSMVFFCVSQQTAREVQKHHKGHLPQKKTEPVGCFYVGLRFFCLFCKMLLHVILTPPARYQHPHDANNPQVGHWGNCKPKWWPQGSTFSSSKTKQRTHKAKRGKLNGLRAGSIR
jgi:hypothetical protein